MRRDKEVIRLVIVVLTLCYGVCQNGVKGNTLKNGKSEDDNNKDEYNNYKKEIIFDEDGVEGTDDTENLYDDPDSDSDAPTTLYRRIQQIPLKLGFQLFAAKHGISKSLDKARQGGAHIYEGVKGAVKTVADFVSEGIGNVKFLLLGSK